MAAASAYRMVPDPGDELLAYGKHIGYRRGRRLGLTESSLERLLVWIRRAATARSARAIFSD